MVCSFLELCHSFDELVYLNGHHNIEYELDQREARTENNAFSFALYTIVDCMVTEVK